MAPISPLGSDAPDSPVPAKAPPAVLGLDEAGRGSWVGPLVVGGFLISAERLADLETLGVRDSKLLTPARREELYERLGSVGERFSIALTPARVDRYVARGRLNRLEAVAFARLVRRTRAGRVYLDACDPLAARFGRVVARLSGGRAQVNACHHADRDVPVVSAASIVAKVLRDRAISRLRRRLGDALGSGYPSDPATVAFVREWLERGDGVTPPWLRRSWVTMERVKLELSVVPLERFFP